MSFTSRKGKHRPTMPSDTGLSGPGKGDSPRNCFSQQFRDNYDAIDWKGSGRKLDFMGTGLPGDPVRATRPMAELIAESLRRRGLL